jgi:predicted dehydrogenase
VREAREVGVGVLGYGGVARAHVHALLRVGHATQPPLRPVLVALCGRTHAAVEAAALRYGALASYTRWQELVRDPRVEILINAAPNDLHADPSIEAVSLGRHVLCEKPLARDAAEAKRMASAAGTAGVVHQVSYNYRHVPAVLLARRLVREGRLGSIYHFRARYCDDSLLDPASPRTWRQDRARAGSGAVGDLASHVLDLARFLVGEIAALSAASRIFIPQRRGEAGIEEVDVEDAVVATLEFEGGAIGTLEASTLCPGRKNLLWFEISGSGGTVVFDLERLNELQVYTTGGGDLDGFRTLLVTERTHPHGGTWWPPGHILGWEHSFVHQLDGFLRTVAGDEPGGVGATFDDGYRCAVLTDALLASAATGKRVILEAAAARHHRDDKHGPGAA